MDKEMISTENWVKFWSWNWSILTCSYWGEMYVHKMKIYERLFLQNVIFTSHEGLSAAYTPQQDRASWGKFLAEEVKNNPTRPEEIADSLKAQADRILHFIDAHFAQDLSWDDYQEYWKIHLEYYIPHVNVKYVVDFLEPELLEKYLGIFQEARLYAEPVFKRTEEFILAFAKIIGKKRGIAPHLILCTLKDEFEKYFVDESFPPVEILQQRFTHSALLVDVDGQTIYTQSEAEKIENFIHQEKNISVLKGQSAYQGKVQGTVRVILDPKKAENFAEGDILVSGMTRPDYLALMKKAGAFVTDSGGLLCHAAIVAREMKKPCVIGTEKATKVLKDGDVVEVDAVQGMVTILQKAN